MEFFFCQEAKAYLLKDGVMTASFHSIGIQISGELVNFEMADNFEFIYSHVKNLRKKIGEAGGKDYIQKAFKYPGCQYSLNVRNDGL